MRTTLDFILLGAGLYCWAMAAGLWWLGIRSFLRRYWETPSRRFWGAAPVDDYFRARAVTRRLRWIPFRLRFFEMLVVGGVLFLVAALVVSQQLVSR